MVHAVAPNELFNKTELLAVSHGRTSYPEKIIVVKSTWTTLCGVLSDVNI